MGIFHSVDIGRMTTIMIPKYSTCQYSYATTGIFQTVDVKRTTAITIIIAVIITEMIDTHVTQFTWYLHP